MKFERFTEEQLARTVESAGEKIVRRGALIWREVRPFFFRPLLPFGKHQPGRPAPSLRARIGGFQHAVPDGSRANSVLQRIIFPRASDYTIASLPKSRRWEVRCAARRFEVRPITEPSEFARKAHPLYVSFYRRTGYSYLARRTNRDHFSNWAESIFAGPIPLVLGAFSGPDLVAASVSRAVDDVLLFSSFFAEEAAMRQHVSSLMLHAVRTAAAESGEINSVFAGMRKSGAAQSVDAFYLLRGAVVESMPAHLQLSPIASWVLRALRPGILRQLNEGPGS